MRGYWKAPELTAEVLKNGAYHSGDLAYADEDGYIFIVDRKKDMIVSGGFNVYPNEVEKALYEHPDVLEACVVGAPDDDLGERVVAVVVPKPGRQPDVQALRAHCVCRLGRYKVPADISFADDLPKNSAGKIMRRIVRDGYWKSRERMV